MSKNICGWYLVVPCLVLSKKPVFIVKSGTFDSTTKRSHCVQNNLETDFDYIYSFGRKPTTASHPSRDKGSFCQESKEGFFLTRTV